MTFNLPSILAVGSGGFVGATLRFYVGIQVAKYFPHQIPLATLFVNITGSLLIGMLVALFTIFTPSDTLKLFLITGFLGALTTYSTFAIESFLLLGNNFWYGVLNICLNLIGSIIVAGLAYKITFSLIATQHLIGYHKT